MSMLEMLMQKLGGSEMRELSGQLGADEGTTQKAVGAALPTLLAALQRNTQKPGGAEALQRALARDHDGSVLNDVAGHLRDPRSANGDGILKHVLGGRREQVERNLSRSSGLDGPGTNALLSKLAPMIMGALGQESRSGNLDSGSIARLLGQEREQVERSVPKATQGIFDKLLDQDGDGDVDLGDFIKVGSGFLGKMFSRG